MTEIKGSYRTNVRDFILQNYLFTDDQTQLSDSASFLKEGILDSMGILELITYIEEEFLVSILEAEMIPDNLDSVSNVVTFVKKKQC